ncbi:MAG: hypothetical protein Q8941_02005 [Bacteroidota bacterium]|nr:hypothetical protein [Bacteroidota bacterium]
MKVIKKISIVAAFIFSLFGLTGCGPATFTVGAHYSSPGWAPPYVEGARYYYFPDIEVYYDLSGQDFVYLDNGQWLFSATLPPIYSGYDIYNGFVIMLNFEVYQPWMHHQYYVSHYPRYYYHNVYRGMDLSTIRGFSEHDRKPIYWKQGEKERINELRRNDRQDRRPDIFREPQKTNYRGRDIGRPVKVKSTMREIKKHVRR